jgi:hypothetical protein
VLRCEGKYWITTTEEKAIARSNTKDVPHWKIIVSIITYEKESFKTMI